MKLKHLTIIEEGESFTIGSFFIKKAIESLG
jgi:hypothetical protein